MSLAPGRAAIAAALAESWLEIAGAAGGLRREDEKKADEVTALLGLLPASGARRLVVDAAAGHGYLGLLYARLRGARRLVLIEQDPARAARAQAVGGRLLAGRPTALEVRVGAVAEAALWPQEPDLVLALHACGAASDQIITQAIAARARWLYLVPCCYSAALPFAAQAEAQAEALGVPAQAVVRRRVVTALVDSERTLRLSAAGYEVTALPFVPESVTPHNLLLRARRSGEPARAAAAAARLLRLRG